MNDGNITMKTGKHDWRRLDALSDAEVHAAALKDPDAQPLTVALANMTGSVLHEYQLQMAGALITALPPLLVYVLLGRYFIRGLLAGSLKG